MHHIIISFLLTILPIETMTNITPSGLEVTLVNHSLDTVYLFNSYLEDPLFTNPTKSTLFESSILHRFNFFSKEFKISFLPLIPYLSLFQSDLLITSPNRIGHYGQSTYSFKVLPPNTKVLVLIPNKAFAIKDYSADINIKELVKTVSGWEESYPIHLNYYFKTDARPTNFFTIEFAIYKNISWCSPETYCHYDTFLEYAVDYETLSVRVHIPLTSQEK